MSEKTNHNEFSCDIIRDLLPSYVDGICSADSKQAVEGHLATCADCATLLGALRESEIQEQQQENKKIAYMKKIKKHAGKKEIIGLGLLLVAIILSLWGFLGQYGVLPLLFYLAILPLVLFDAHFLLTDHTTFTKWTEAKTILTLVSSLLVCLGILVAFVSIQWVKQQSYPFGLKAADIGKFLQSFYFILALCQLAIFIAAIALAFHTSNSHGITISISATGFFLVFYILSVFQTLSSTERTLQGLKQALYILLEGVCIAVLAEVVQRRKWKED